MHFYFLLPRADAVFAFKCQIQFAGRTDQNFHRWEWEGASTEADGRADFNVWVQTYSTRI